jgi:endonuclease YncB( thermonuclease family)
MTRSSRSLAAWLCMFAIAALAQAAPRSFQGVVTHVGDGDTLWVRPERGGPPVQLRLQGIDAPEICQPWGMQARAALSRKVLHQPVAVRVHGRDHYGRALAEVRLQGDDLGTWMVGQGHAWSYRWRSDAGPHAAAQSRARQARRGLWRDPGALEPRAFRRRHGTCDKP